MRLHFEDGERDILRARLGLAESADDTAIAQAVATWMQETPAPTPPQPTPPPPEEEDIDASVQDVIIVDTAEFNRLRQRDRVAGQVEEALAMRDRNELIEEAIADGKFGPARREHYRNRYDSDPEGTKKLIARLQRNTVPLEARGIEQPTDEAESQAAYPTEWLPEVHGQQALQAAPQNGDRRMSRVHGE